MACDGDLVFITSGTISHMVTFHMVRLKMRDNFVYYNI